MALDLRDPDTHVDPCTDVLEEPTVDLVEFGAKPNELRLVDRKGSRGFF